MARKKEQRKEEREAQAEREARDERVEASTMPDRSDEPHRRPPFWIRHKKRWPLLLLLPVLLLVTAFGIDRARSGDQVMRGVAASGRALAGLDREASRDVLTALEGDLRAEPLLVEVQGKTFELAPEKIGLVVRSDEALDAALRAGRDGNVLSQLGWWMASFSSNTDVPLSCEVDAAALAAQLDAWQVEAIENPPFEGSVTVVDGRVVQEPPRAGQGIDRERARTDIVAALCAEKRAPLELALVSVPPTRTAAATAAAAKVADELLRGDITLIGELPPDEPEAKKPKSRARAPKPTAKKNEKTDDDDESEGPETARLSFSSTAIAAALRTRLVDASGMEVYLDAEALEPALAEAREKLERKPVDARFVVERGDKIRIEPSRVGRVIDPAKVVTALMTAAKTPEREGTFPIDEGAQPKLSTEDAKALGIKGLVSKFTTSHPCCRPRVENIHKMADLVDGVLLKPGETFSINEHVGERTTAKGFKPAPTIVHGEMKDTVGGGVSQFATTFFNAAFHGGYGIIERQPHSFYFTRYPMGHEATLSFPKPDVIIKNDTEAGLLIKTYYTGVSITVKMYGDNGGRKVRRKVSRPYDLTDPPIEYIADDTLEPDETKVKARGKKGWTLTVSRVVEYPDGTEKKETRKVIYKPRVRKLRVHSCRIPKGEDGYTGEDCPEPPEDEEEDESESDDDVLDTPGGDAGVPEDAEDEGS